jgi:hypothetical protein
VPVLRFLIPLALAVVVVVAAATASARHDVARQSACKQSERQLASVACRR